MSSSSGRTGNSQPGRRRRRRRSSGRGASTGTQPGATAGSAGGPSAGSPDGAQTGSPDGAKPTLGDATAPARAAAPRTPAATNGRGGAATRGGGGTTGRGDAGTGTDAGTESGGTPQGSGGSGSEGSGPTSEPGRPRRRRRGPRRGRRGRGTQTTDPTATPGATPTPAPTATGVPAGGRPKPSDRNGRPPLTKGLAERKTDRASDRAADLAADDPQAATSTGDTTDKPIRPRSGRARAAAANARGRRSGRRLRTVDETSAGGLVVNTENSSAALIGRLDRRGRLLWSLPKGHLEAGETAEEAAIREVAEETGINGRVLAPLGTIDYWFVAEDRRVHKTVHHFLMEAIGGELCDEDIEVTEVAWVPLTELDGRLAYADERKLVRLAAGLLSESA